MSAWFFCSNIKIAHLSIAHCTVSNEKWSNLDMPEESLSNLRRLCTLMFISYFYITSLWIILSISRCSHIYLQNDFWAATVEIPYWWRIITHTWVVPLISWGRFPMWHMTKQKSYPDLGNDNTISMEFLQSSVRLNFAGKAVVVRQNVGCFLRLWHQLPHSD